MSRINTNVQSLLAQRVLGQNNFSLNTSLERLSTGLKINRGKDDPAGLIASENLRAEQRAIGQAIANAERADQVVNIGEGGLQEISGLLTELQGLLTASANKAGIAESERTANQLQVDSILQTIDRIAGSVSFQGVKLLNGNYNYQTSGQVAGVSDIQINGAKFEGSSLDVDVLVTQSAQQAGLFLSAAGTAIDLASADDEFQIEITGTLGSRELTFGSGATLSDIAAAINTFKDVTGVEATTSGTGIKLSTTGFGADEFVSVTVLDDGGISGTGVGIYDLVADDFGTAQTTIKSTYAAATNPVRDEGQDIGASINGIKAVTDGRDIRIATDFLDVAVTLDVATSQTLGAVDGGTPGGAAFTIAGGGADFQLAGQVDISGKVSIGIGDVSSRRLGSSSLGYLDDLGSGQAFNLADGDNVTTAQQIVSTAIDQISSLRGRLGAFQKNTVGATVRNLSITLENTQAAESVIRDTDFASETAQLTRSQILVAAATNVLSLANSQPQAVLQLLG
ncbi:MAG: flagellin [Phycisphaerales bacterium JB039]